MVRIMSMQVSDTRLKNKTFFASMTKYIMMQHSFPNVYMQQAAQQHLWSQ